MSRSFAQLLIDWFGREGRALPWRRRPDPYRVWVSEIMLQQTTVATATPYYDRFVARYPTVEELAAASPRDVLALWSGLGYYHRARNMLEAARLMVRRHAAKVPSDEVALRALPGIGAYTAGAILSIGHGLPHAALDGNTLRVMARVGGVEGDTARAGVRKRIERLALDLMASASPSAFNQALMDLGAMVCSPRRPSCERCPVSLLCRARQDGTTDRIPRPRRASPPLRVEMAAFAIRRGGRLLLMERARGSLMKGLWEFPLRPAGSRPDAERQALRLGARVVRLAGRVSHTITRHRMAIDVYEARPTKARTAAPLAPRPDRPAVVGIDSGLAVSEPALRLSTPEVVRRLRWATLEEMARSTAKPIPLTGTARKIRRLLAEV